MQAQAFTSGSRVAAAPRAASRPAARRAAGVVRATAAPVEQRDALGFEMMRKGVKVAAKDSILTPR